MSDTKPPSRQVQVEERLYDLLQVRAKQSRDGRVYGLGNIESIIWTIHSRFPSDPRPSVHEVVDGLRRLEFTHRIKVVRWPSGTWVEVPLIRSQTA